MKNRSMIVALVALTATAFAMSGCNSMSSMKHPDDCGCGKCSMSASQHPAGCTCDMCKKKNM